MNSKGAKPLSLLQGPANFEGKKEEGGMGKEKGEKGGDILIDRGRRPDPASHNTGGKGDLLG